MLLDLGMAESLKPWLPKLANVAVIAGSIQHRVAALMSPDGIGHMEEFISNVVARVILDGSSPADAVSTEAVEHFAGKNAKFMASFSDGQVQAHLDAARLTAEAS